MVVEWKGAGQIDEALVHGLRMGGDALLANTLPLVPEDEGDLKGSGSATVDGDSAHVEFDTAYARIQHQRTRYQHDTGQALFLKTSADAFGPEFEQIVGEQVAKVLGG